MAKRSSSIRGRAATPSGGVQVLAIIQGPYSGQPLSLPDDVAAAALADGWALDSTDPDYDRFNVPFVDPGAPYPQSLVDYLASLDPESGDSGGGGDGGNGQPAAPPVLTSLDPTTAVLNDPDVTLHCYGSGFTPESVIVFADQDEPIVFISAEEITTVITLSLPWGAVTVPVLVRNADGVESAALDFTFTDAA